MKKSLLFLTTLCLATIFGSSKAYAILATDYGTLETVVGQPITMSATGTPQRAQDVPANMTIITADEIRQSGSRDIPEILSRVPGLDILHEGVRTFDVGVRGYQQAMQPRMLVLIDGRQVFSDDYSRTIWENLPINIDDIRQIEVVKGPSSALFGSNAAGGVINIITYNPLFDNNNVATATMGTQASLTGDATTTAKMGNYGGIKISAGGLTGNAFDTPRSASEKSVTTDPEHRYLTSSSVFQVTSEILTDAEVTYSKSAGTEAYYNGQFAGVNAETWSARAGFSWQTPWGTIKNNNYVNHSHIDNDEISTSLPEYSDVSTLLVSQLEDQFKLGKDNTFRIFGEYQNKSFNLIASESAPDNTTVSENNFAAGGMWMWQMTDKLAWTNALREDHMGLGLTGTLYADDPFTNSSFNHSLNELSANSGFVYQATDKDTFRLTYGRGVEMPSLLDYGFNSINLSGAGPNAFERVGNPDLNATIVTNYELDYDRVIQDILSTAKFSVFYETNADIISPFSIVSTQSTTVSATTRVREPTNIGSSNGLGGEVELVGKSPEGFRWDASYSYASVGDSALVLQDFGYEDSTPMHHFRLLLGYTTGPWEFDTNAQYLTSRILFRLNTSRQESDGYTSVGGRIGYQITPGMTVALSGTDLTSPNTQESPYPDVERQVMLSLTAKF